MPRLRPTATDARRQGVSRLPRELTRLLPAVRAGRAVNPAARPVHGRHTAAAPPAASLRAGLTRLRRPLAVAGLLAACQLAWPAAAAAEDLFLPAGPPPVQAPEFPVQAATPAAPELLGATLRSREVRIDRRLLAAARVAAEQGGGAAGAIDLNFFDDTAFRVVDLRAAPTSSGYALTGRLAAVPGGTMALAVNDEAIAGVARMPGATYTFRSTGDGLDEIRQTDPSTLPEGGEPLVPPAVPAGGAPDAAAPAGADASGAETSQIDVLIVYTTAARLQAGGEAAMRAEIDLWFAAANGYFTDSGVDLQIRLAHAEELDYVETPSSYELDSLTNGSDGTLDEVHAIRRAVGADLVHLIERWGAARHFRYCGIAYMMENVGSYFASYGFGTTVLSCGSLTFAHELGHNMGLRHDRYQQHSSIPSRATDKPYAHAYGYVNQAMFEPGAAHSQRWLTIMSYSTQCRHAGVAGCVRVGRFSNPDQALADDPLGVWRNSATRGSRGPADAATTLNSTRRTVARFGSPGASPAVVSLRRRQPPDARTNRSALSWRLAFSRDVRNVTAGDFQITGPDAATPSVTPQAGSRVYDIGVTGLDDFNGEATLGFAADQDIEDLSGAALNAAWPGHAERTYTVDQAAPSAAIEPSSAGSSPFVATIVFTEDVTGFEDAGDVTATNATVTAPSRSDARTYTVQVTPTVTDAATVALAVPAGAAQDAAGNASAAATRDVAYDPSTGTSLTVGGLSNASIAENRSWTSGTPTLTGSPAGTVTWTREGVDAHVFTIDSANGVLGLPARNFESPADANADNQYEVTARATDANGNSAAAEVVVTVTDAAESKRVRVMDATSVKIPDGYDYSERPYLSGAVGASTWSKTGADAALFALDSGTGALSLAGQDFEDPADADDDNVYEVTVRGTDADGNSATANVRVQVTKAPPQWLTISGLASASVPEDSAWTSETPSVAGAVGDVAWTIEGPDAGQFSIDADSGVLRMQAQDYENPVDADDGNTYDVRVRATDEDGNAGVALVTVTVTDVVPNGSPEPVGSLSPLSLRVADGAESIDVADAFRDPNDDPLTYAAASSDGSVATVSASGSTVEVTPVSGGTAEVTVTAEDPGGLQAEQRFEATVENRSPEPVGTLPPLTLRVGGVQSVNVAGAFEDPDGDPLTFEATSSDTLVATVSARGSTVRVSAIWSGTAAVTVTAEDPGGLQAEQVFELTVPNRPPVPVGRLPALSLASGDGPASVDASGAFADPDDDPLTFEASSSAESVAAAAAFGSVVEVTPLSAGTAEVTVTATDWGGSNGSATQRFGVGVDRSPPPPPPGPGGGRPRPRPPNRPPEAVGTLEDQALTVGADAVAADVAAAFRDPDRDALEYAAESSAEDVAAAAVDGSMVTVTPVGAGTAVVTVTASDGEAGNAPAEQAFTVTVVVDYDSDADGLIEVRTLAQLDAVRHDLDGDGMPAEAGAEAHAAAFEGAIEGVTCGGAGCRGYELLADLDFDTNGSGGPDAGDAYWNDGSGWLPIGTGAEPFAAAFEGNGRVIRGLFVAGGEGAGLFGATAPSSVVVRVGLIGADVTGTRAAGALAGVNGGRVTASWATGRVSGTAAVGGLLGSSSGNVGGSYAAVAVSGERQAGGLVGFNEGGLAAVYATGRVSGTAVVGGLVGHHRGTLTASYATGRVRGTDDVGGLAGTLGEPGTAEAPGTVTVSYWDTETSGAASSAAGVGLTTSALRRPTAYGGPYAAWNVDVDGDGILDGPWHLGTAAQYPALTLDVDGDGRASWPELGRQLRAGPELMAAPAENLAAENLAEVALAWTAADASAWTPAPEVTYTVTREAGATIETGATVEAGATVEGATVETVAAGVRGTRYVDADVQPGGAYTYQVAAAVDGGEAARSARVTAEVPCAYAATPPQRDVLWTAGTEQVTVTTAPGCAWTAASESGFLAVTGGATGTGSGTVRYTVAANAGGPRTGVLVVAGRRVTVYQASATQFTDHPIERGATPVRAIHFLELRARIDALRAAAGQPAFQWTDPVLAPGVTTIRRVHLTELRAALAEAYSAAGRAAPPYADPLITAGATGIRAAHLMELRAAVAALE